MLQKIYDSGIIGRNILYIFIFTLLLIGFGLWFISRPIVALAHLFMLHPHTAWEELKETNPSYSTKDWR